MKDVSFFFKSMDKLCGNKIVIIFKGSINDEKRELYGNACKIIELTSKYIQNGYMKIVVPFTIIPYLFMSYFNYYAKGLEEDAFILPFVVWYVMTPPPSKMY